MTECMCGEIWIGGTISAAVADELCGMIRQQGAALGWGDAPFAPATAADLLAERIDKDGILVLWLCDDQAQYGQFTELEEFLEAHGIAFDRRSDGKYEFDPLYVEYRPGCQFVEQITNHNGNPMIPTEQVLEADTRMANALTSMHDQDWPTAMSELQAARELLREALPPIVTPLTEFTIAGRAS